MIAKILSSSKSFSGVAYNEHKNSNLQSELIVAKNFDGLRSEFPSKEEYKNYLKLYASTNDRIKKPQFHATISTKGKEHSFEELREIAEKWVDKMGYGKQPYLIYGHKDTDNNHVHIVSVRVDENGKKINDSFEKNRAKEIIDEIMGRDLKQEAEQSFQKISEYKFSSVQQFKLLFETAGWGTAEKDGNIHLSKGGKVQKTVDMATINEMIQKNAEKNDEKRASQIKALLHKYKEGLNHIQLKELMKEKFGIHLEFHTGKGHTTPYGYTVIDHNGKSVYKGSDLVNIKEIVANPEREQKVKACDELAQAILEKSPKMDLATFQAEMDKIGYRVDTKGKVYLGKEKTPLYVMNQGVMARLNYQSRVTDANKFNANSRGEKAVLAQMFCVKKEDITGNGKGKNEDTIGAYADMMKSYLGDDEKLKDELKKRGIVFLKSGNQLYLVDTQNKNVVSNNELKLDLGKSSVRVYDGRKLEAGWGRSMEKRGKDLNMDMGEKSFEEIINDIAGGNEQDPKRRRKKGITT